jgi:uncharacterized membrane protein YfcA
VVLLIAEADLFGFDPKTAVDTTSCTALSSSRSVRFVTGAGHGNVDLHAMAWLLVGSIPGVLLGSHLSIRVPEKALRTAFAFTLILSGIKLVKVPAATTIIEVCIALAIVALTVWSARQLLARRPAPLAD